MIRTHQHSALKKNGKAETARNNINVEIEMCFKANPPNSGQKRILMNDFS